MLRDDIKGFKHLDFTAEERMTLADLIQSDAWKLVQTIANHMFMSLFISMTVSPPGEKGDNFYRGSFFGLTSFLDGIEEAAKPPKH